MKKFVVFFAVIFSILFSLSADEFTPDLQLALSSYDYLVTPGDIYTLNYYDGTNEIHSSILIDSSYKIKISNFAELDSKGRTYVQLKQEVEAAVSTNIKKSSPEFILSKPGIFKIVVNGEVEKTAERQVWSLTRLSSIVNEYQNTYSSERFITVTSVDGRKADYDLFKASRDGEQNQNPFLRPGDVVTINRAGKKIAVYGAVERPSAYELSENDNLKSLIDYYARGLYKTADTKNIRIVRKNNDGSEQKIILDESSLINDFHLLDGDEIYISDLSEKNPVVYIEGSILIDENRISDNAENVEYRMSVRFEKGMNLADFVRMNSRYFSSSSDIQNAYIIRKSKIIPQDLSIFIDDNNASSDLILLDNDVLKIPYKDYYVFVNGSVLKPGKYPYVPDKTYEFYINMAGGFIKSQNSKDVVDIIDVNGKKLSKSDFIAPETQIVAKTNSGLYYFNQYMGIIATLLSIVSTVLLTINFIKK